MPVPPRRLALFPPTDSMSLQDFGREVLLDGQLYDDHPRQECYQGVEMPWRSDLLHKLGEKTQVFHTNGSTPEMAVLLANGWRIDWEGTPRVSKFHWAMFEGQPKPVLDGRDYDLKDFLENWPNPHFLQCTRLDLGTVRPLFFP